MRLEVCGGESCKGTVDSRCPGGRGGGGATRHGGVGNTCTFGRSLEGGEGVGGPWKEEREWEVLRRRRGSGSSLGGGEGVGGPCTVNPTHVHSLSEAHFLHSLVCCCEAPSEGHMEQPHTYGISCNRGCSSQILPFLLNSHFCILRCWPLRPAYPLIAKCLQANLSLTAADQ